MTIAQKKALDMPCCMLIVILWLAEAEVTETMEHWEDTTPWREMSFFVDPEMWR